MTAGLTTYPVAQESPKNRSPERAALFAPIERQTLIAVRYNLGLTVLVGATCYDAIFTLSPKLAWVKPRRSPRLQP